MKKLHLAMTAAALPLLTGCFSTGPDPGLEKISAQLDLINVNLEKIHQTIGVPENPAVNDAQLAGIISQAPELAKIKPLPANPTNKDIADYIDAILKVAPKTGNTWNSPYVQMLRLIGTGHLEALVPYLTDRYVNSVFWELIGIEDLDAGIKLLPEYPTLYYSLQRFDPDLRLKEPLKKLLQDDKKNLTPIKGSIPLYFSSDEDIEFLKKCYRENPQAYIVIDTLAAYQDTDPAVMSNQRWENIKNLPVETRLIGIDDTIRRGNKEALAFILEQYATDEKLQKTKRSLNHFFDPAPTGEMSYEQLWIMYQHNKDKLKFDPATRKYKIQEGDES